MNYSFQRAKILETVMKSYDHPTAEMIYNRVKKIIPNISMGTIYRNLNLLADNGDISKISMPSGDRFDRTIYPHCHIRCRKCNNVEDFYDLNFDKFKFKNSDYEITSIIITLEGICKKCQQKRREDLNGIKGK